MGSSFSVQHKERRRRSNRLSKPPQNQSAPGCPSSRSLHQSGEQALSLPSTPTAWQNPWTGAPISVGSNDFVSHNLRSQSFSAKPLRRKTTWKANGPPIAQRSIHSTADIWPQPPTSPTPAPSRRGSLYGRASFHPSEVATFQPTTLQSNSQSPLIGQPKRSYSVHSPPQRSRTAVQQRRTIDRFASFNSHTRVECQETPPIRRRSLLVRPGVATRKATKDPHPIFFSESCHDSIISPDPINALSEPAASPWPTNEDVLLSDVKPFSQLRPATPSDLGYTHLGTLKLGSLRVVNGSASPCPSDRMRLDQTGNLTLDATDLSGALDIPEHVSQSTSSDGLEMYAKYRPIIDTPTGLNHAVGDLSNGTETLYSHMPAYPDPSARNGIPTAILNTSCFAANRDDVDFPASPFSFEKSPTSVSGHGLEDPETEDEGISVHDRESALISLPDKVPERHLSYSSCASSHKRGDSGYNSATSHRNSIDSHASLRRSPGYRKLNLGDGYKNLEFRDINTTAGTNIQPFTNRHLSLQDYRWKSRQILRNRPTSIPRVQRVCCGFQDDIREEADFSDNIEDLFPNHPALRNQKPFIISHRAKPKECRTRAITLPNRRHSSAVKSDHLLPVPSNAFSPLSIAGQASKEFAVEPPRGRSRSRSIGISTTGLLGSNLPT
ncbi:hypothetical protein BDV10DRAFT_195625 [Aspergillus recurvatus]